jgi:hypothetical protein
VRSTEFPYHLSLGGIYIPSVRPVLIKINSTDLILMEATSR